MVDTPPSSSDNAQPLTARRATHSLPVTDDDDEPPSSRPNQNGDSQMTSLSSSPDSPHPYFPPVKPRDTFNNDIDKEKIEDIEQGVLDQSSKNQVYGRADTATTFDVDGKQEGTLVNAPATPRPRRRWYSRFRISKKSRIRTLFTPAHDIGPRPTYMESFKAAILYTYLNILLLFIPVSWALYYTDQSPTLVFVFSCLAIIPLAALLGLGTEQIALRTSQSVGGLLNATLGNVVEMIIGAIALSQCQLELVQSSLLGGQLSNLLLVLGTAFLVGGMRFQQSEFQPMVAQLNSSLLIVSVISFFIPVAFHTYLESRLPLGSELPFLLRVSHGSAVILLVIYLAYLFFQFYSHNHLFVDMDAQSSISSNSSSSHRPSLHLQQPSVHRSSSARLGVPNTNPDTLFGSRVSLASALETRTESSDSSHIETLKLNLPSAFILLGTVTALVYFTAEHLVESLEGLLEDHPSVSKKWITLIVIPIIGNAAEYATAVLVARKGKFNLSMSVAVGSCIQIAFFVIPILVLVAWGLDKPLTLLFDPLENFALFFSVLVVKFAVEDGKAHWLNGLALISVYTLWAVSFWGFPATTRLIQGEPIICVR